MCIGQVSLPQKRQCFSAALRLTESPVVSSRHRRFQLRKQRFASHLAALVDIPHLLRERRAEVVRGTSSDRDAIVDHHAEDSARIEVCNNTENIRRFHVDIGMGTKRLEEKRNGPGC